tara:strand:+ start:6657 stop:9578 length:2922 start_codon:yes stop_codon:yes gene_type:complete
MAVKASGTLVFGQVNSDDIRTEFGEFDPSKGLAEYFSASTALPDSGSAIAFSDFYGTANLRLNLAISQSANPTLEAAYAGQTEVVYNPEPVTFTNATDFGYTITGSTDNQAESEGYRTLTRNHTTYYAVGSGSSAPIASQSVAFVPDSQILTTSNGNLFGWTRTNPAEVLSGTNKVIWRDNLSQELVEDDEFFEGNIVYFLKIPQLVQPATVTDYVNKDNFALMGYVDQGAASIKYGAREYKKNGISYWRPVDENGDFTSDYLATRAPVAGNTYEVTTESDFGFGRYGSGTEFGYQVWREPGFATNYYLVNGKITNRTPNLAYNTSNFVNTTFPQITDLTYPSVYFPAYGTVTELPETYFQRYLIDKGNNVLGYLGDFDTGSTAQSVATLYTPNNGYWDLNSPNIPGKKYDVSGRLAEAMDNWGFTEIYVCHYDDTEFIERIAEINKNSYNLFLLLPFLEIKYGNQRYQSTLLADGFTLYAKYSPTGLEEDTYTLSPTHYIKNAHYSSSANPFAVGSSTRNRIKLVKYSAYKKIPTDNSFGNCSAFDIYFENNNNLGSFVRGQLNIEYDPIDYSMPSSTSSPYFQYNGFNGFPPDYGYGTILSGIYSHSENSSLANVAAEVTVYKNLSKRPGHVTSPTSGKTARFMRLRAEDSASSATYTPLTRDFVYTGIVDSYTPASYYTYAKTQDTRSKPVYVYTEVDYETRPTIPGISSTPELTYDDARKWVYRKSLVNEYAFDEKEDWLIDDSFSVGWRPQTAFDAIKTAAYYAVKMDIVSNVVQQKAIKTFTISGTNPSSFIGENIPVRLDFSIGAGDSAELGYDQFFLLYRAQQNGNVQLSYISPQNTKPSYSASISGNNTNFSIAGLSSSETYRLAWRAYQTSALSIGGATATKTGTSTTFAGNAIPSIQLQGGDTAYTFRQGVDLFLEVQISSSPSVWATVRCFEYFRNGNSKTVEASCDFLDGFTATQSNFLN